MSKYSNAQKEQVKDCIIEYLYYYLHYAKVKHFESQGLTIEIEDFSQSPELAKMIKSASRSGPSSLKTGTRKSEFCCLLKENNIDSGFRKKLERNGFKETYSQKSQKTILDVIDNLCDKGYLERKPSDKSFVKLTEKGLKLAKSSDGLYDIFQRNVAVRKANLIALIALLVSVLTFFYTIFSDYCMYFWPSHQG